MPSRSQLSPKDRAARSRLVKILTSARPMAIASLVTMARTCGKKHCRCTRGEKHVSLYLSTRIGKSRKMIYVPPQLEELARQMVHNSQDVQEAIEVISQATLAQFEQLKKQRKETRS